MPAKDSATATCSRCARALPPGNAKACVWCGTPLPLPTVRSPSLGFGFAAQKPRDPLVGQVVAGRFKLEELIGQGGMGKVYRARHLALDRLVCLKMLKPALLEDPTVVGRFEREAKAASRLNHANSIQVLDFGRNESDGGLFIAMEYVQGKDLRVVLRDEWPVPEERLCNIMAQVLAALGEAHAHNVIHRDLKPENIMVEQRRDQTDFVKVLDFGIAKILDSDLPGLTRSDVVCGTPQYMAPEQATGTQLDARCDLYAVGVILYQMVTGHLPFDGQNSMDVLTRHVNERPMPPRRRAPAASISGAMEALILHALEKNPAARPQTAEQFRQLVLAVPRQKSAPTPLRAVTEDAFSLATPALGTTRPPSSPAVRSRRPLQIALAAGGVAVAALAASAVVRGRRPTTPASPPTVAVATPVAVASVPGEAVQRDPQKARKLVRRASEQEFGAEGSDARDLLMLAVALDPDNAEAHYRLGGLFLASNPVRARLEYEAAKRLDPAKYGDLVDAILKGL
ncbi:MAG TPA: serine/threonine-protein kinase [Myxococcales bacterium]|nr:serine/threonine-protein kinase [Myxococcales bacterium]